jgi:hypothetical protein
MLVSVPMTLFFGSFTDTLCVELPLFYASLCSIAIMAPITEEFAKAYPLVYRHGETEKSLFTLGFLIGIGFGVSEFFLYVFVLNVPFLGRIPALIFHGASTSITAYGIARKIPFRYFLLAVVLHFTNNFSALLGEVWFVTGVAAQAIALAISFHLYQTIDKRHPTVVLD